MSGFDYFSIESLGKTLFGLALLSLTLSSCGSADSGSSERNNGGTGIEDRYIACAQTDTLTIESPVFEMWGVGMKGDEVAIWNDALEDYPNQADMDSIFAKGIYTRAGFYNSYDENPSLYSDPLEASGMFGAFHQSAEDPAEWFGANVWMAFQQYQGELNVCIADETPEVLEHRVVGQNGAGDDVVFSRLKLDHGNYVVFYVP
jgi:hypothetical protein